MAEALISLFIEQLASIIQQEDKLVMGVKKEVAKLTSNFKDIEVVLKNAEERKVKEVDVTQWLERLKDVSYEMDDVLDKSRTEILKQEAGNASSTSITKKRSSSVNQVE